MKLMVYVELLSPRQQEENINANCVLFDHVIKTSEENKRERERERERLKTQRSKKRERERVLY